MVFSSNEFLFLYLPLFLVFYFLSPKKYKNAVLLISSLAFYAWERPIYLPLMMLVIAVNFAFGSRISRKTTNVKWHKRLLVFAVAFDISILIFFKYTDFLIAQLQKIPFLSFLEPIGIALPIGISFYIFQTLSYVVDVYRGTVAAQRSAVDFSSYVTMFPQLIAGPIVRYGDVERELSNRRITLGASAVGARRFIVGLSKKVLLADAAGALWEEILSYPTEDKSVLILWLGAALYSFQIYFDFSGYSDMAIGLGKILGFKFPENFNYPYISRSITEFWRRWHITLSSFFREYVYIPLGGNRVSLPRHIFNLLAVWLLTGLWHGASWNFVLWGFYYFVLLTFEKFVLARIPLRVPNALKRAYSLALIAVGWLIFYFKPSEGGIGSLWKYICGMLGFLELPLADEMFRYTFLRCAAFLVLLAVGSTPYPKILALKIREHASKRSTGAQTALFTLFDVALFLLFALSVVYINSSEYRPNIYFEF